MDSIFYKYLCCLHVPHTRSGSKAVYDSVPDKNSLYGYAETLEAYGIKPEVVKPGADTVPCIVEYDKAFVILRSVEEKDSPDSNVKILTADKGERSVSAIDFFAGCSKVGLKGKPDASSAEPEYRTNLRSERIDSIKRILLICALVFLGLVSIFQSDFVMSLWGALALLVNLGGIYVTYLLLLKQLHVESAAADHLCSIIKKSHCDSPKLQAASTVLGMVTLAEIGMGFFVVNTLVLLFFPGLIKSVALLSAAGLLFSFWSVWYQRTQAHTWCTLCLITLTLMWLQAGIYLIAGIYSSSGLLSASVLTVAAFYGAAILGVSYLVNTIGKALDDVELREQYNDLRHTPGVMKLLIDDQPLLDGNPQLQSALLFGNPAAKLHLTVFANPYCVPCSRVHARIADYLRVHPDSASVRYTLTYFSDDRADINRYLIAAYFKYGAERSWDILTGWYAKGRQRGASFFSGMDLDINSPEVTAEFDKQLQWRKASGLTATPILMVDGHKVPHDYTIDDLSYLTAVDK